MTTDRRQQSTDTPQCLLDLVENCLKVVLQVGLHTLLHRSFGHLHVTGVALKMMRRGIERPSSLLRAFPPLFPALLALYHDP